MGPLKKTVGITRVGQSGVGWADHRCKVHKEIKDQIRGELMADGVAVVVTRGIHSWEGVVYEHVGCG